MKINLSLRDRDGIHLDIGDWINIYDWGVNTDGLLIGRGQLVFDHELGCIQTEPIFVEDQYDFYNKALPKCKISNPTNHCKI